MFHIGGKTPVYRTCTEIDDASELIANEVLQELTDWKLLGEELGLKQYQLYEIHEDNRLYENRRRAMWRKWFDGEERGCWERIITALVNIRQRNRALRLAKNCGLDLPGI